ncbi:MAG: sulfur carrier protein [Pseudonocardiales bacterium]|jgi:sulfur carrier protein|nr:sulfur carrier protein [Pseudonocardiales bacterium]MDT4921292.1 sulfur carrier protein [Pseudonocardiales bacterium]MDT4943035.1 sulfur carrier protein [Pseudonocardiales bacterium]
MTITFNGAACVIEDGTTLETLLQSMSTTARGFAAAIDGEVVPRPTWQMVVLREGQAVEVLTAVQGG